ncbi:TPA: hypothetical protein ACX6RM_001338 [Photobacterium damselae]
MAIFTGFDAINRDAPIAEQMPIQCIGNNPAVIDGRGGGNAIRISDGSYLYISSQDRHKGHYVAVGAALRVHGSSKSSLTLIGAHTQQTASPDTPSVTFGLFIQDGWIYATGRAGRTAIRQYVENEWFYVEIRFEVSAFSSSAPMLSSIYIDGIEVYSSNHQYSLAETQACSFIAQSTLDVTIDVDDLYFERKYQNTSSTIPVLASGKISCLALTETKSNDWAVTGAATANAALSDNDDATYISSDGGATGVYQIDSNVSQLYGININVRGKTDTNGVTAVSIVKDGQVMSNEQAIGLKSALSTATLQDVSRTDGTKIWTDVIKSGAQIKVTT